MKEEQLLEMIYDKEYFNGLPKAKFMEALRAEGIQVKNGIDSNLHKHQFIDAYLNLDSFKRMLLNFCNSIKL